MRSRTIIKVGDVFSVPLDASTKRYFQYIANDQTQLDSDVIRAFKLAHQINAKPDLSDVVSGEVAFYAHLIIKLGIKMGLWEKVGSVPYDEEPNVLFKHSWDWGKPGIQISHSWSVWRINGDFQKVGKLEGDFRNAEIGIVFSPPSIVDRMRRALAAQDYVYEGYPAY